ncbi:hypothetical protein [Neoroseomonas soli]|uniref:Uncharacterized protein n=1 Tax=Neoroseomonas soli TaxID=1081025 RepID=A0A9X9WYL4_9PROT|nr:hypothetical protein [Neoroseomonas soli]MBR0672243.1 hypothetical protein [Neoroseomonas soli]
MPYDPSNRTGILHRQAQIKQRALAGIARTAPIARRAAAHTPPQSRGPSPMVWRAADACAAELLRRNAGRSPRGPHWRLAITKEPKGGSIVLGVAESACGDAVVLLIDSSGNLRDADSKRLLSVDEVEQRMRG